MTKARREIHRKLAALEKSGVSLGSLHVSQSENRQYLTLTIHAERSWAKAKAIMRKEHKERCHREGLTGKLSIVFDEETSGFSYY